MASAGGCGIGGTAWSTVPGRALSQPAGPGRRCPRLPCGAERAGSDPAVPAALRRAEPAVPGSCRRVSGAIRAPCSRPHCKYTHTHTGTGARFYFTRVVSSVKKESYPLKSFPEPVSSLELLLSSPCHRRCHTSPSPSQGCPSSSRGRRQPPLLPAPLLIPPSPGQPAAPSV